VSLSDGHILKMNIILPMPIPIKCPKNYEYVALRGISYAILSVNHIAPKTLYTDAHHQASLH
jgi:hypothetical protein